MKERALGRNRIQVDILRIKTIFTKLLLKHSYIFDPIANLEGKTAFGNIAPHERSGLCEGVNEDLKVVLYGLIYKIKKRGNCANPQTIQLLMRETERNLI